MLLLTFWKKNVLKEVREFFWPLLDDTEVIPSTADENLVHIENCNLSKALDLTIRIFDSEEDRRKSIESKAAYLLSSISVATSLVVASNTLITGNSTNHLAIKLSVIISFILSLYTVRTVWFSIKALQRGSYSVLDFSDINKGGDSYLYQKNLISSLVLKVQNNLNTINSKVDDMTMAQEYYKRAIIVIAVYAFLILISYLFF